MARSLKPSLSASAVSMMSRSCRSRMPSLSRIARPKLSEMRCACAEFGQAKPDHFESGALAKRDDTGAGARGTGSLGHGEILSRFRPRELRPSTVCPSGAVDQNRRERAASGGGGCSASMGGVRPSGPSGLRRPRPPMSRRRPPIARDLPLKGTAVGSDRSTNRGSDGRGSTLDCEPRSARDDRPTFSKRTRFAFAGRAPHRGGPAGRSVIPAPPDCSDAIATRRSPAPAARACASERRFRHDGPV